MGCSCTPFSFFAPLLRRIYMRGNSKAHMQRTRPIFFPQPLDEQGDRATIHCMQSCDMLLNAPTLVLNRSWSPVFTVSAKKAVVWLFKEIVQVVHDKDYSLHDLTSWADLSLLLANDKPSLASPSIRLVLPEVVKLVHYNGMPRNRVAFTRRTLFLRDNYRCQYCGAAPGSKELTIDHVLPLSRGGKTTWENCVLSCVRCNTKKGSRTPQEAGLAMIHEARAPKWSPLSNVAPSRMLNSWQQFVSEAYWNVILKD